MAATGNGSSQYLATASSFAPLTTAYTWAFWYQPAAAPATGAVSVTTPFGMANTTGTPNTFDLNFCWDHDNASFYKSATHHQASGGYVTVQHPGTPATGGDWHHVAATWNGTTLTLYYDGASVASAAATAPPAGDNWILTVCAHDSASFFDPNPVAELAIWSTALTAAEVMSLRTGTAPSAVQSGSLVSYSHLNTGDITTTGNALTNHSATLNVTYFVGNLGGLVLGGNSQSTTTTYNWTNSGGLVLGGTTPLTQLASASNTIAVSEFGVVRPAMSNNVAISQSAVPPNVFSTASSAVLVSQRALPITHGVLAAGRAKGSTSR